MRRLITTLTIKGCVGFGQDESEAKLDVRVKLAQQGEVISEFQERLHKVKPWMPMEGFLHTRLGCIRLQENTLVNSVSKKVVRIEAGRSVYGYIAELFEDNINYVDIAAVLHKHLDAYFTKVDSSAKLIRDMPVIYCTECNALIVGTVIYKLERGLMFGVTKDIYWMTWVGIRMRYCVSTEGLTCMEALAYLGYRLGYSINKKDLREVKVNGQEDS